MTRRAKSHGPAARFGIPVGAALVLAGCRTAAAEGSQREPLQGDAIEASAKTSTKTQRTTGCPSALIAARRGGSDADRYRAPSEAQGVAMADLVARLAKDGQPGRANAAAAALAVGFRIDDVPEMPGVVVLRELPDQRHGGGAYLLRLDRTSTLIVQAPHTFFDEGTLQLGCELFERASAAAFFIDTAHRYKAAEIDEEGNHPADVAHASDSLFQAATMGFLRAIEPATVVQLHGFAQRESGADVVLSEGTSRPRNGLLSRVQQALVPLAVGRVERFPDESPELGATTNVQGALVRKRGGRFLHVEMSSGLRKNLLADGELRARYLEALARSLSRP